MSSDQLILAVTGIAIVSIPGIRAYAIARRHRRARRDAAEHARLMAWTAELERVGEEQRDDPRVAAMVARHEWFVTGMRPRVGAHRAVPPRHRARMAASA